MVATLTGSSIEMLFRVKDVSGFMVPYLQNPLYQCLSNSLSLISVSHLLEDSKSHFLCLSHFFSVFPQYSISALHDVTKASSFANHGFVPPSGTNLIGCLVLAPGPTFKTWKKSVNSSRKL